MQCQLLQSAGRRPTGKGFEAFVFPSKLEVAGRQTVQHPILHRLDQLSPLCERKILLSYVSQHDNHINLTVRALLKLLVNNEVDLARHNLNYVRICRQLGKRDRINAREHNWIVLKAIPKLELG